MQKYKCHIVKNKNLLGIPCFLGHEPKRREQKKTKTRGLGRQSRILKDWFVPLWKEELPLRSTPLRRW
jgi:hypothetical protein